MKTLKAPNFEESLATSLVEFANAQPIVAAFILLMLVAVSVKVLVTG